MTTEAERQAAGLEAFVGAGRQAGQVYGIQWGDPEQSEFLRQVRDDFLLANLRSGMTALEIGSGGGRWSQYFAGHVERAILVDATPASEAAIRARFDWPGFEFHCSPDGQLPSIPDASIDFAFSFDTFVHFEAALFDQYVAEIGRVLRPAGKLALHYAHRWPECEQNATCFRYREDADVERSLENAWLEWTGRALELRGGYGSIVREAIKPDNSFRPAAMPRSNASA